MIYTITNDEKNNIKLGKQEQDNMKERYAIYDNDGCIFDGEYEEMYDLFIGSEYRSEFDNVEINGDLVFVQILGVTK